VVVPTSLMWVRRIGIESSILELTCMLVLDSGTRRG